MGYMGTGLTEEEVKKLAQGLNQPVSAAAATATAPTNTPTKTATNYVPLISANKDPNGGNTTEYRAPREGDTGIGVTPPAPATPTPTPQPISAPQANAYKPPDYAALAAARTALALQQKKTIAEQQKNAADASYNQQTLRTNDTRTLQDFQKSNSVNPFTQGKQTWDRGIIGRERTQADADSAAALATQKGNIDQLLADYENATADEQVRIADELERADRAYKLDLDTFNQNQSNFDKNFNYNSGQDSIKNNQNQQQIDYSQNPNNPANQGQVLQNQGQAQQNILNQYKIDSYPAEQKAAAEQIQQQLKAGKLSNDAAEFNLKQLKDPNSTYNQAAKIDLQLKQLDLKNAPEKDRLQIQQLQKQIAEIGKVHTTPQTQMEKDMDQVKLDTARKQLDLLNNPEGKPQKATDYKTNPDFASDVAYIKSNPASADMLETNAQDFINRYGYDGYNALRQAAGLD